MLNASVTPAVPRLAATVMLLRDRPAGFEVWLAKRSTRSRFMPGASVFPGGAVDAADDADEARSATVDRDGDGFALRHAALRELFEEAGVLLACTPGGDPASAPDVRTLSAMRGAMHRRERTLDAMLLAANLRLDARALVAYSNWITPRVEPIRFDTHFFIARAPDDHDAEADAFEMHDGIWLTPADALSAADARTILLTFPTRAHVERLARYATLEALFAHAQERVIIPLEVEMADVIDPVKFEAIVW